MRNRAATYPVASGSAIFRGVRVVTTLSGLTPYRPNKLENVEQLVEVFIPQFPHDIKATMIVRRGAKIAVRYPKLVSWAQPRMIY